MPSSFLPSPNQTWVHGVDNKQMLLEALRNDTTTAIETDILMGHYCADVLTPNHSGNIQQETSSSTTMTTTNDDDQLMIPIMAHPPNRTSDLTMSDFLDLVSSSACAHKRDYSNCNTSASKIISKIIKLDFKEMQAVEPTLQAVVALQAQTTESSVVFLNADILPGPGNRGKSTTINAEEFMETSLKYMCTCHDTTRMAFSLGFKTDWADPNDGYTAEDLHAMSDLISRYHQRVQIQKIGMVLALNARQLAKSLTSSLDDMLRQFSELQILAWTGKGEPPIPQSMIRKVQCHFEELEMTHRIGFDCQVSY